MDTDTIAAVATAMGNSGISMIRVSGENAVSIADKIFSSKSKKKLQDCESHTIHYGFVLEKGQILDEVMASVMRKPKTYTREDTVEISCHGGALVTKKVLEAVIRAGARLAEPGEFTKRAFLNGRIDLSEAEAVMNVISAENEYALKASMDQLHGSMLQEIRSMRQEILSEVAYIEAVLDDPEHLSFDHYEDRFQNRLSDLIKRLTELLNTFENGRLMREGIRTVILGKPNVGKSSLLNLLAKQERAIVTDIPGTTRDALEERIVLTGMTLIVTDTAGIRKTEDQVEKIGIAKAKESAEQADVILYVADASKKLDDSDREILSFLKDKKAIVLLNKSDLPHVTRREDIQALCREKVIEISAKEGSGVHLLEQALKELFFKGELPVNDRLTVTSLRQKTLLEEAKKSLLLVLDSFNSGMPEDFYTIDLMSAYQSLGKIIGESVEEDLVNEIFAKFCMGK